MVAVTNRRNVGANRAVCRLELEHGLVRLHRQRHKGTVMFEHRQAIRIRCGVGWVLDRTLGENSFTIAPRNARDPAILRLHGPGDANTVLQNNVSERFDLASGQ